MKYDVIANGIPTGEVEAGSKLEAVQLARESEELNPEQVPIHFIWVELAE